MTARVPISRRTAVIVYLLAIAGVGILTLKLVSLLASQAIALTQPYFLDNCPCMPSLIEQRRIAAQIDAPAMAERTENRVAALATPSIPVDVLAAQMDLAEREDLVRPTVAALSMRDSH